MRIVTGYPGSDHERTIDVIDGKIYLVDDDGGGYLELRFAGERSVRVRAVGDQVIATFPEAANVIMVRGCAYPEGDDL